MAKMSESYKNTLIAVLLMGIVAMTIIYANFTHYLNVRAQEGAKSGDWNIHFENLLNRTPADNNNTAVVNRAPIILSGKTEIAGLKLTLNKPGDNVVYTFDIVNSGDYDARLDDYVTGTPQCSPTESFCNNVIFNFKYTDGNKINQNDILKKGDRVIVTMTVALNNLISNMPNEKINIDNLTGVFYYVQK